MRLFRPVGRRNPTLQVFDSAGVRREFRYGAEQRKFGGLSGELNDLTDELQRNLVVRRIFLPASIAGETVSKPLPRAKISPDLYEWGRRSGRNGPGMTPSIIIALAPAPIRLSRDLAPDRPRRVLRDVNLG